jgi:Fic/DOC family
VIYSAALPDAWEEAMIASIHCLCESLEQTGQSPRCWNGLLSRQVFERRMAGGSTNSTDGGGEDWRALEGYRRAMRYAARRAVDPSVSYTTELILALHFMMTEHDRNARPGGWRSDKVQIHNSEAEVVYEAPKAERVPELMQELLDSLNGSSKIPPVIRAAIAHLNMLRIHPFRDGSGRMGRCLQALILSHESVLCPEIANLEEYIGQYTPSCNDALASTGARWEPNRDTRKWVRFCLTAHYRQAIMLLKKVTKFDHLRRELIAQQGAHGLSEDLLAHLSQIFAARPAVIARWWRMRPDRVVERISREALGYRLRDRSFHGEAQDLAGLRVDAPVLLDPKILEDDTADFEFSDYLADDGFQSIPARSEIRRSGL